MQRYKKMMKKRLKHFAIGLGLFSFSALAVETPFFSVVQTVEESGKLLRNELTNDQLRDWGRAFFQRNDMPSVFNVMYLLALKGDRRAQLDLGRLYFRGEGVEQNYEKAHWWFSEAAEQGSRIAVTNLGILYAGGYGVKKNLNHGIYLLEKTASANDSQAMLVLGTLYYNEIKIRDFNKAFKWLEKGAKQGNEEAIFRLALMYERGEGTKRNRPMAISIYKDLIAQQSRFSEEAKERLNILSDD